MAAASRGDGPANEAKADAVPEGAAAAALASLPTPARSLPSAERGRPGASAERRGLWRIYSATVLPHGGAQDTTSPDQALADLSRMLREEKGGRSSADGQAASPAAVAAPEGVVVALGPPESPKPCSLAGSDDATPQSATSIFSLAVGGAGFSMEARASVEAPEVIRARQRAARAKENAMKAAAQRRAATEQAVAAATAATPPGEREEADGGKRAAPQGTPIPATKRRITCKTTPGAAGAGSAPTPPEAPAAADSAPGAPPARPEPLPRGAIVPLPPMVPWSSSPAAAERRARKAARTRARVASAETE